MQMKNSNIAWIGEIPQDWEVGKVKNIGEAIIGLTYDPSEVSEHGVLVMRSSNVQGGKISLEDCLYVDKAVNNKLLLQLDDILICSRNGSRHLIGKCALIDERVVGQTFGAFMTVLRTKFPKWLFYIFNSSIFDYYLASFLTSTVNQLTSGNLNNISIPLPPLKTQQKIANFLDSKCGKIDSTIEREKEHIEKLKEYRQSLITEAVTKGLNPNTPMKDSGIEWIGEIPQAWEVKKIKHVAKLKTGSTPSANVGINQERIGYSWFTPVDFTSNILSNSSKFIDTNSALNFDFAIFPAGTILLVAIGATTGKVGITNIDSYSNQQITAIMPVKIENKFLYYYFCSIMNYIKENALYTTLQIINNAYLSSINILFPPLAEQKEIADYLDKKTAQIDKAIAKKESLIEKLQEYKKSLIFEAVTGKLEV